MKKNQREIVWIIFSAFLGGEWQRCRVAEATVGQNRSSTHSVQVISGRRHARLLRARWCSKNCSTNPYLP